jgi:hypothetical protein
MANLPTSKLNNFAAIVSGACDPYSWIFPGDAMLIISQRTRPTAERVELRLKDPPSMGRSGRYVGSSSPSADIRRMAGPLEQCSTQMARFATKIARWLIVGAAKSPDWPP